MDQKYRNFIMWVLYALFFLVVMLVQTTLFGRVRIWGVKLNLLPVAAVCIALHTGHEAGGLFGLIAALFWSAAGGADGSLSMITFTVIGVLSGWLCDVFFPRRFLSALLLSLGALLLHETAVFFVKFYLGGAEAALLRWVPVTAFLSLLAAAPIYLLSKAIRKAGASG